MKLLRDICRGAGYLEGYGHHPGTSTVLIFILLGALVGAQTGIWDGVIGGAFLVAMFMIPIWMIGCVSRARMYQRDVLKTFDILSKTS